MIITKFIIVAVVGYLLGSIPFGLLISKRSGKVDVRQYGSGKIGATNVLRAAGRKAAALVLLLDASKGALAVVFAGLIIGRSYLVVGDFALGAMVAQVLAALAAEGESTIDRVYHIDRGYDRIEERLNSVGASVKRFNPVKEVKKNE